MELQWIHPFSAIVAGPSGSGKSFFVIKLIENIKSISNVNVENIYWHYSGWLPNFKCKINVVFKESIPDITENDTTKLNLIIIDDLMRESDGRVVDLFTRGCHHKNLCIFYNSKYFPSRLRSKGYFFKFTLYYIIQNPEGQSTD